MNTLLGYIRVSGKAQAEKDGPERQRLAIETFCSQNSCAITKIFSDPGVSGTVEGLDRPGLFELLLAAETEGASGMVVENLSRLARDIVVQEIFCRELRQRKLALYAADQGMIDLTLTDTDPSRKLIRQVFGMISEFEKSTLVIKLRVARERKKKATGKCEGRRAFGAGDEAIGKVERIMLNMISQLRRENGEPWSKENLPASWQTIAVLFTQNGFKKRNGKTDWTRGQIWTLWENHKKRQRRKEKLKNEHMLNSGVPSGIPKI